MIEFQAVYDEFSKLLYKYILFKTNDKFASEDILQEVFVKLYKNIEKPMHGNLKSWLYAVAKNEIINYYRKTKPSEILNKDMINTKPSQSDTKWIEGCIEPLLSTLSHGYRDVMFMREYDGLSVAQISDALQLPVPTVKSKLQRGRKKLKSALFECCAFELDKNGFPIDFKSKNCSYVKC